MDFNVHNFVTCLLVKENCKWKLCILTFRFCSMPYVITAALSLWPPDPRDGRYMHTSHSYLSDNFSSHLIADQNHNISKVSSLKLIYNFIITTNVFRAK